MRKSKVESLIDDSHYFSFYDADGQWNGGMKIKKVLALLLDHLDLELEYKPMKEALRKRKK